MSRSHTRGEGSFSAILILLTLRLQLCLNKRFKLDCFTSRTAVVCRKQSTLPKSGLSRAWLCPHNLRHSRLWTAHLTAEDLGRYFLRLFLDPLWPGEVPAFSLTMSCFLLGKPH